MTESEVLDLLQKVGAFRSGHFVFTSGLHSDSYVNKDALFAHPNEVSQICRAFAERFADAHVDAVLAPAVGGVVLSQWTAYHLGHITGREVYGIYADKDGNGGFVVKRGYDAMIKGKNVLVVDDLTTTGGSIKKVVEAARAVGANVVSAAVIANRGDVTKEQVGNPDQFVSLVNIHLESWPADDCDLCKKGIPVNTDVGHGMQYMARKNG